MNKIDLIIDALELANRNAYDYATGEPLDVSLALAAARELKELQPVAWGITNTSPTEQNLLMNVMRTKPDTFNFHRVIPLYALDEVTK